MRQQNGARVCCQLGENLRPWVHSPFTREHAEPLSAHSGLLTMVCSELSSRFWYTRSFNIQPAKKHSFWRYCVISWGRFSTKKLCQIHLAPPAKVLFCLADLSIRPVSSGYSCYIRSPKWVWWKKTRQNQTLFASFFRIFWITFITACQPRLTCSEKKYF